MSQVVNTRRLFARLLRTLDITTVCDVGSMDGSDAQLFRRRLPQAKILALEPNPQNFLLMSQDERLRGIQVLPFAASDQESEAPFFVVKAEYSHAGDRLRRGMSSLHRRADESQLSHVVPVRTVRLDKLLAAESALAFWIDAEGMAYEVISGADGVLANTRMLHVEVETAPCIGSRQRLFDDVRRFLEQAGFELLATDQPLEQIQFNALFVRVDFLYRHSVAIDVWLALAWLRSRAARLAILVFPLQIQRRLVHWFH